MSESNSPKSDDAVLGGKISTPLGAVVMGGIEGVKHRLVSTSVEQRIVALPECLKYEKNGVELIIAALQDESLEVRKTAYLLLQPIQEQKIQSVLKQYWKFLGTTDYTQLQKFLTEGRWKDADEETLRVMLKVASRESKGWLDRNSITNFPCDDFRTINQLWLDYSYGRFGFSVQTQIWLECGGNISDATEVAFGDRLGWRVEGSWIKKNSIRYNLDAPPGHLPVVGGVGDPVLGTYGKPGNPYPLRRWFCGWWYHLMALAAKCSL